jgi:protocatechuate 3,4-dioxygenase beta subunit
MKVSGVVALLGSGLLLTGAAWWLMRAGADGGAAGSATVLGHAPTAADASGFGADAWRAARAAAPADLHAEPADDAPAAAAAATPAGPATVAEDTVDALLRGRVVDAAGAPIAGATVVYWPNDATLPAYGLDLRSTAEALDVLPRSVTNASGRFELPARHRNHAEHTRHYNDPQVIAISGDLAVRAHQCEDFTGGELDVGDLALEPGARLTGRIVDEAGRPVAGARVQPWNPAGRSLHGLVDKESDWAFCNPPNECIATTSGADGRFATGALWDGRTQLSISADGFLDEFRDKLPVKVGERNDLGDIVLARGTALAGLVRDAQGTPVADARVLAFEPSGFDFWAHQGQDADVLLNQLHEREHDEGVRTDAAGRFLIGNRPPTNHSLFVDAAGFEPLRVGDLLPGRGELSLTLIRAATLRLAVIDAATHELIAAAAARARRLSESKVDTEGIELPVHAGERAGVLVVERLGLRRTQIVVEAPGWGAVAIALEGATPPARLERIVELPREVRVTGRVTATDGAPIDEATVVARSRLDEPFPLEQVQARSDAEGRYALAGLGPGDWLVTADAPEFAPAERELPLVDGMPLPDTDFLLQPAASVFGVCSSDDGTPETRVRKLFTWTDPQDHAAREERETRSDDQGRYELRDLRPGTWHVSGNPSLDVTLAAGERRELDLLENLEARIAVQVLHADGTPVPHAWVFGRMHVGAIKSSFPILQRTDDEGRFRMKPAQAGRYDFVGAGGAPGGGLSAPMSFELHEGEQRDVDLRLGTLVVRGLVVDSADGSPVAGAEVSVLPLLDDGETCAYGSISSGSEVFRFHGVSDAEGRFEVQGLSPGRHAVSVSGIEAEAEKQPDLALAPGSVAELQVRVTRTGFVAGSARTASGVPVKAWTIVSAERPGASRSAAIEGGRFELKGLLPGTWTLTIKDDEAILVQQNVTVVAGQQAEAELIVP